VQGRKGENVIEEVKRMQSDQKARDVIEPVGQKMDITHMASRSAGTEKSRPGFNKFIYENFRENLEGQVETWNRMAVRNPNPEVAHALWLKAEGLGYAIRLLYAFEPEFRELVECASRVATCGTIQQ
jgi:hypothetical protein